MPINPVPNASSSIQNSALHKVDGHWLQTQQSRIVAIYRTKGKKQIDNYFKI